MKKLDAPILYSFRRCPYAMRARLALYSQKVLHEHREVDLKNKPSEMLEISPKGTVPVLQRADGTVLDQSLDIMVWAFDALPLSREVQKIIEENDTSFKAALDRYKYPDRYHQGETNDHRMQCEMFIKKIEGQLAPFLGGSKVTLLDMAIFPFIRQFSMVDPDWFHQQPYPLVEKWLDFLTSSHLFQRVMQIYSPWSAGDEPILITF
jgi:glutathione S-transferase